MLISLISLFLLAHVTSADWPYEHVLVDSPQGPVQGDVLVLHNGVKVNTFLGIPFAEPPVGSRRWRAPEDPSPWTETLVADTLPSACIQDEVGIVWLTNPRWRDYSEDCLYVNVFAPNDTTAGPGPYPVLVWFFGGGFQAGANIQYPGHFLAAKGTVVVVPNYRLNIIGFASTGDGVASGNYGMLDQVKTLEWVQRNIFAYNGDPSRVTIFGQSAGGASTGLHLVSALSAGLFHQAIPISGSDMAIWAVNPPASVPETYTTQVAEQNNCPTANKQEMIDCLRLIDAQELNETPFNCTPGYICLGMVPVVDGIFLTDTPTNLRKAGKVNWVPEIIGQTREEATIGLPAVVEGTLTEGLNRTEFEQVFRDAVAYFMGIIPDPTLEEDLISALTWFYSPWPHLDDKDANRYQLGMLGTDVGFGFTADIQMKAQSRLPQPVYQYLFSYISDAATVVPDWMGCPHMLDVPYVWGFPLIQLNPDVRNQSGVVDLMNYTDTDIAYTDFWMTLITNFAKEGNPTPTPVATPTGDAPVTWSQFTPDNLYNLYVGNDAVEQREDYRQQEYAFWHSYLNLMVYDQPWPFPETPESGKSILSPVRNFFGKFQFNPREFRKGIFNVLHHFYGSPELPEDY